MDAEVTLKVIIKNCCDEQSLLDTGMTFEEMVKFLIEEEGIMGLIDAPPTIVDVQEITGYGYL